jgi:phage terminase Nu1 subunit (DNA packaging protein)
MTANQIMELAERVERSSALMMRWLSTTVQTGGQFNAVMAYDCAKVAGHYANRLIDLAELGDRVATA